MKYKEHAICFSCSGGVFHSVQKAQLTGSKSVCLTGHRSNARCSGPRSKVSDVCFSAVSERRRRKKKSKIEFVVGKIALPNAQYKR